MNFNSLSATLIDDLLETMHRQHGERLMNQFNVPEIYVKKPECPVRKKGDE